MSIPVAESPKWYGLRNAGKEVHPVKMQMAAVRTPFTIFFYDGVSQDADLRLASLAETRLADAAAVGLT
jgi:hypothetical protein